VDSCTYPPQSHQNIRGTPQIKSSNRLLELIALAHSNEVSEDRNQALSHWERHLDLVKNDLFGSRNKKNRLDQAVERIRMGAVSQRS